MTQRGTSNTSKSSSTLGKDSCKIPGSKCNPDPPARHPKKYGNYAPYRSKTNVPSKTGQGNKTEAKKKSANAKPVYVDTNNSSNPCRATKSASDLNKASSPFANDTANIFKTPLRAYKAIAADVVRADCMNHGYRTDRTIGKGAYAKVKLADVLPSKLARNPIMADLAQEYDGSLQVAIKIIECKHVPKEFLKKFLPRELGNHVPLPPHSNVVRVLEKMRTTDHTNEVRVLDEFRTTDRIYVVMEYCSKGDLLDLINNKISSNVRGLGEDLSRRLFIMMAEGVHHIHHNGIVHRDLKCENILVDKNDTIKITDFGFSTRFEHGKGSMLNTSCGSYAYTAPEVIQMKQYDGIKSDVWSLGVILFAMLNGRLPFNGSQLNDLEDYMKVQKLEFERHVSIESMVLVRRILQYNPSNRPCTDEILLDPWLTGAKHIPRQITTPKWINPYTARKDEGDASSPAAAVGGTNPVYYKGSGHKKGPESTITINHERNETVVLKSRAGNKKNIWTSGPPQSHRPNTWPRSEKGKVNGKSTSNRGSTKSQLTSSMVRRATKTTIVGRPHAKNGTPRPGGSPATKGFVKGRANAVRMSTWFIEKYMHAAAHVKKKRSNKAKCGRCKTEISSDLACCCEKDESLLVEENIGFAGDAGADVDTTSPSLDFEDVRFPSPVKNEPEVKQRPTSTASSDKSSKRKEANPVSGVKAGPRSCASAGSANISASRIPTVDRKQAIKSACVRSRTAREDLSGSMTSRRPGTAIKTSLGGTVNQTTSPASRAKNLRDKFMVLYNPLKARAEGIGGFPPLRFQPVQPSGSPSVPSSPKLSVTTQRVPHTPRQPRPTASSTQQIILRSHQPTNASSTKQQPPNKGRQSARATITMTSQKNSYKSGQPSAPGIGRARRGNSGNGRALSKPVQRVVVHSSIL